MKYKLIIFDIDGTIARHISSWRSIHETLGLWDVLAHNYQEQFLKGTISYRQFCLLDAAHWKGVPDAKLRALFKKSPYMKNAAHSIRQLKKKGFKLAAVSTGLQYMAERLKEELGFDYCLSNRLVVRKGLITGGVRIYIPHGGKGKVFSSIAKRFRLKPREIICVGDTAGDIPLLNKAGYSIAFNSTSKELSRVADYNCRTQDFKEVYAAIMSLMPTT